MALDQYTNSGQILETTDPTEGLRYTSEDLDILQITPKISLINPANIQNNYISEFHVYSPDGTWMTGNHQFTDTDIKTTQSGRFLQLNLQGAFTDLGLIRGQYKIVYNFHHDWVGSAQNQSLFLKEISPDRDEVHLVLTEPVMSPSNSSGTQTIGQAISLFESYVKTAKLTDKTQLSYFILNFGQNNIYKAINAWVEGTNIYIKLYEPLPEEITEKQRVWISSEVTKPYVDNIVIQSPPVAPPKNTLRGPNFDAATYNQGTETDFKTWTDLLDTTTATSQQIIDNYFSGSLQGVALGIDYTDFNNFIHYGSAEERVKNFYYKVQLIEHYDDQINYLNTNVSGSDSGSLINNVTVNQKRKDIVIGGFDNFERWLYNDSTSSLFTHGITGSLTTFPKYIQTGSVSGYDKGWKLHHSTSSLGIAWYNGFVISGSNFDRENQNALLKNIPEFIQLDESNDQFLLFVNMIGQHFDILWSYIKELTDTFTKEEHPKLGTSNELLYDIAQSMGVHLVNGKQADQLWQYKLGKNVSGSFQSTGSMFSKSSEDLTYEVWRRIVNNLPYILKTKGTSRSIKALMNSYGIPSTLLSIREYGGPAVANTKPALVEDRFSYALRIATGSYVQIPRGYYDISGAVPKGQGIGGDRPPDTVEFRFQPELSAYHDMPLLTCVSSSTEGDNNPVNFSHPMWDLGLQYTGSLSGSTKYGRLRFSFQSDSATLAYQSASTDYIPLYDNDWWNVKLWTTSPYTSSTNIPIYVKVEKASDCVNGQIVHSSSLSLTPTITDGFNIWCTGSSSWLLLGGNTGSFKGHQLNTNMFTGSVQEYHEWVEVLTAQSFDEHTLNPASYVGSNPTSSYYNLVRQYKFGTNVKAYDHSLAAYKIISSSHPNQLTQTGDKSWFNTYASMSNFQANPPGGDNYERVTEQYYINTPSIGGDNLHSEKIRLEDNSLIRRLSPVTRGEQSQYDTAPVDSPRLGLFYSAQDQINKDIFDEIGFIELDNYIGNPADEFESSYPELIRFSQEYWQKFTNKNDVNAYIRIFSLYDFSLFQQIKQLLPARSKVAAGLLIEPNILERSKVLINKQPTITEPKYDSVINWSPTASADYPTYTSSMDWSILASGDELTYTSSVNWKISESGEYQYHSGSILGTSPIAGFQCTDIQNLLRLSSASRVDQNTIDLAYKDGYVSGLSTLATYDFGGVSGSAISSSGIPKIIYDFGGPSGSIIPGAKLIDSGSLTGSAWYTNDFTSNQTINGQLFLSGSPSYTSGWRNELRSIRRFKRNEDVIFSADISVLKTNCKFMVGFGDAADSIDAFNLSVSTDSHRAHVFYFDATSIAVRDRGSHNYVLKASGVAANDKYRIQIQPREYSGSRYTLYKHPDLTTPIATTSSMFGSGLSSASLLDVGVFSKDVTGSGLPGADEFAIDNIQVDSGTGSQWNRNATTRTYTENGVLFMSQSSLPDSWDGELRSVQGWSRTAGKLEFIADITIQKVWGSLSEPRMMIGIGNRSEKPVGSNPTYTYKNAAFQFYLHTNDIYIYEGTASHGNQGSGLISAGLTYRLKIEPHTDAYGAKYTVWNHNDLTTPVMTYDSIAVANPSPDVLDAGIWSFSSASTFHVDDIAIMGSGSLPMYIPQPMSNPAQIETPCSATGAMVVNCRPSYIWKKVIYHYSSSAAWATTPYKKGWDIAISESKGLYYSRSLEPACYRDDEFTGQMNLYYNGCKLEGEDFNVDSRQTTDGGPVVSFTVTSPNILKYSNLNENRKLKLNTDQT